MQKALFIYNPVAGTGKTIYDFDRVIAYFQSRNICIVPLRTHYKEEMLFSLFNNNNFQYIFVAGGDGTLNMVLNSLLKYNYTALPPLGIIPTGTSNDLAGNLLTRALGFGWGIENIKLNQSFFIDVGKVGAAYFINIASGGVLIDVGQKVDQRLKNNLGMLAYYLKGILEISKLKTVEMKIKAADKEIFLGEAFLFLILNGKSAGSFNNLAPKASLTNGLLDCLIFKKCSPADFLNLFLKLITGKHITDSNVLYFQAKEFSVSSPVKIRTDLDGEKGPPLPWEIEVLPRELNILQVM